MLFDVTNIVVWRISTLPKNILRNQEQDTNIPSRETERREREKENEREREGKKVIERMIEGVTREGGEGLILRRPHSPYVRGRSDSLIKVKVKILI